MSFAQSWHHYLFCTVAACDDDTHEEAFGDRWHDSWSCDYWQPSASARRAVPVAPPDGASAVSYTQSDVFERLRQDLAGHDVCQEILVNQFPVDILIDGRVCVEVDGPEHFIDVPVPVPEAGQAGTVFTRERRTKDLFIDHMLRQYGYRVFRIANAQYSARLDELVQQVAAALASPGAGSRVAGQQEPQPPQGMDTGFRHQPQEQAMAIISAEGLRPQEWDDYLSPRLRALRACESRISALQNLRPSRDQGVLQQRRAQLRTEAGSALRQARTCAAQGDLRQLGPDSLGGMINSFAKMARYPVSHDLEAVVACLGHEVEQRAVEGSLVRWPARQLALVANGFSKSRRVRAGQGMIRLAQALLGLAPEQLTGLQGWTAQPLAMMIDGLGKVEGDAIVQALAHLAQAVPEAPSLRPESGWTAQHLAMVVHGLARSEGEAVQDALTRLALAIRRQDLTVQAGWTAQNLAMTIKGLDRGEGPAAQEALAHLAGAIPEAEHLTPEAGWSALYLEMAARGLGKRPGLAVMNALIRVRTALARRQLTPGPGEAAPGPDESGGGYENRVNTGEQGAQGPAPSMHHFHALRAAERRIKELQQLKGGYRSGGPGRRNALLREEVDSALRSAQACASEGELRQVTAASLAGMINSFAKMRAWPVIQGIDGIMACLGQEVSGRAARGVLAHWSPLQLALVANGLSKGEGASVQEALLQLARAVLAVGQPLREQSWSAQYLAMMVNGLSKGEGAWIQMALAHLAQVFLHQEPLTRESGWNDRHLAMMANGLSRGREQDVRPALKAIARAVRARDLAVVQGWGVQSLAMMVNALGRSAGDRVQEALSHLAQAVLRIPHLVPGDGWTAQRLVMMADGLGKGEGACIKEALAHIAKSLPGIARLTPEEGWGPRQLAMMVNALSRGDGPDINAALLSLATAICDRPRRLAAPACVPQDLAMMAQGLGRGEGVAVQEALTVLAQALCRHWALTREEGWTGRDLGMMAHGLAKGEGPEVQEALARLAQGVRSFDTPVGQG